MMRKKHLFLLMLMWLCCVSAGASTWKRHSCYYTNRIKNVYDTGDKVYYLNDVSLFRFDKSTRTTVILNNSNILSDNEVSQIYYDWQNKLLFIAYLDCNIDIVDEAGHVYNVSRLKDVISTVHNVVFAKYSYTSYTGKTINDITFADGTAYVAVDYGYVTIDEATKTIKRNVTLTKMLNVNSVAVVGDKLVFLTDENCYYGPIDSTDPLNQFSRKSGSFKGAKMYPIDATSTFVLLSGSLQRYNFLSATPAVTTLVSSAPTSVQKAQAGFIANFAGQKFYYTINDAGTTATKASSTLGFATSDPTGDGTVWINDGAGLRMKGSTVSYKLSCLTTDEPYWLKYNTAMDRLYVCTSALNALNRTFPDNMADNVINYYDGENWHNATPLGMVADGSGYEFVFNPADSTTYFRTTWQNGLHRVTNDVLNLTIAGNNSPFPMYFGSKAHPAFDKYGNLWVVQSYGNSTCPVAALPSDKVGQTSISKSDWFQPDGLLSLETGAMQRSRFIISKKNNVKIYADCEFKRSILCWDNFNEDLRAGTYQLTAIPRFVDQNNQQVEWPYLVHMEQMSDGNIWVGTSTGLFYFDPDVVFDDPPRAVRPYVTNYSECNGNLCEGYSVLDIAEDADHNKWIATNSGIFYVSPDGTKIYDHFTMANSDIPGDMVYSVECDNEHGRVYIFTDGGFAEYVVEGDAVALDFSSVYAFPSPVEPDFTGLVKIAGLMEGSYVTITDRNGNVVAQMGPVSGSVLWDVCDASGERVVTGVYNIYATQGGQPATNVEPQATVMVIK